MSRFPARGVETCPMASPKYAARPSPRQSPSFPWPQGPATPPPPRRAPAPATFAPARCEAQDRGSRPSLARTPDLPTKLSTPRPPIFQPIRPRLKYRTGKMPESGPAFTASMAEFLSRLAWKIAEPITFDNNGSTILPVAEGAPDRNRSSARPAHGAAHDPTTGSWRRPPAASPARAMAKRRISNRAPGARRRSRDRNRRHRPGRNR